MKKTISLPYGTGEISAQVEESQLLGIVQSQLEEYEAEKSPEELLRQAMENPIGTSRLEELAKGKKKVGVLCSDHTRPVPSKLILPPMLEAIRRGNPQAEITLLIATGCHRGTTRQELVNKLGAEMAEKEHILIHDWAAEEDMVEFCPPADGCESTKRRWRPICWWPKGLSNPTSLPVFPEGAKVCFPALRPGRRYMPTTALNLLTILMPERGFWKETPFIGIWCGRPARRGWPILSMWCWEERAR